MSVGATLDATSRSEFGQFFTPAPVADFLAGLLDLPGEGAFSLLDPGAGVGSLSAAVVARVIAERPHLALSVTAFEVDSALVPHLAATLDDAKSAAAESGVEVDIQVVEGSFIEWAVAQRTLVAESHPGFNACIMNPPYRKVNTGTPERSALERFGLRVTNLYPAFMALAAELLADGGQLCSITPRSFANGPYFEPFRQFFLARMAIERLHVYEKRGEVFADSDVLQENVVMVSRRARPGSDVVLSTGDGLSDLPRCRAVPYEEVLHEGDKHCFVRIPVEGDATAVAERFADLPASLDSLGIQVSTGRVVDFRAKEYLRDEPGVDAAPLLYPGHFAGHRLAWPPVSSRKPVAIERCPETEALMLPEGLYVLVKRFTAKEEPRRVVAALLDPEDVPGPVYGVENHLNVFHRGGSGLERLLALGLLGFLNCTRVDRFVRQFSGHTQINATDLRQLAYPALSELRDIGAAIERQGWPDAQAALDLVVDEHVAAWREGDTGPLPALAEAS